MEYISYLENLADIVRLERKERNMNQINFYKFLFPNTDKEDENIKKKMNAIENAKLKNIDFEFINNLCDKCDICPDYIFMKNISYRNHELETICNYTGLSQDAAIILHEFQVEKNNGADLSLLKRVAIGDESKELEKANLKSTSINMLTIINYLLSHREAKDYPNIKSNETNLTIIYDIYRYCIGLPEILNGVPTEESANMIELSPICRMNFDLSKETLMKDSEETWSTFDARKLYKQIAKEDLMKDLDKLSDQYKIDLGI